LLIAGASRALGAARGGTSSNTFTRKAGFIEFTRRAYDALQVREDLLATNIAQDTDFLVRRGDFALRYDSASKSDSTRAVVLSELDQYLLIIEKTLYQVPQVLTSYLDVISSYLVPKASQSFTVNEPGKENLRSSPEELRTHLDSFRAQYPVVRDFLRVAPQTRAIITQWQLPPLHGDVRTQ
jgi:hypothetical protein